MSGLSSGKDLLQIRGLELADVTAILDRAGRFQDPATRSDALAGRIVINLFLEPSTRTRVSFEIAAKRLSADVVNMSTGSSSLTKGESLVDTTRVLDAMNPSFVVVRHSAPGAPRIVADNTRASVVNAGDGAHEHPTQALLDARTILDRKGRIDGLRVAIVGDILHSRVARSNAHLLTLLGAHVVFAGPRTLIPEGIERIADGNAGTLSVAPTADEAIDGADVVMTLRIQLERQGEPFFSSLGEYHRMFGLTAERLERSKPDSIVMHPGPVNRGVEMSPDVADGPRSVLLHQVANGVAVRMAVLDLLAGSGFAS